MSGIQSAGVRTATTEGAPLDGRVARRERGRAAVLAAVMELFDEGEPRPSTDVVVARSGVSSASLFRYFGSLDEMYRAAFDEQIARAEAIARVDHLDDADLAVRIEAFVSGRCAVFESVLGVARMARSRAIDDPGIARGLERARRRWLAQVRAVFAPELDPMAAATAAEVAAAVDAVASFEAWDLLVHGRGVASGSVRSLWATAIAALLSQRGA